MCFLRLCGFTFAVSHFLVSFNLLHYAYQEDTETESKRKILSSLEETMEEELKCSICSELLIEATSLNCSHSFCAYCIKVRLLFQSRPQDSPVRPVLSECLSIHWSFFRWANCVISVDSCIYLSSVESNVAFEADGSSAVLLLNRLHWLYSRP